MWTAVLVLGSLGVIGGAAAAGLAVLSLPVPLEEPPPMSDPWSQLAAESGLARVDELLLRGACLGLPARISVSGGARTGVRLTIAVTGPAGTPDELRIAVRNRLASAVAGDDFRGGLGVPWLEQVMRQPAITHALLVALGAGDDVRVGTLSVQVDWDPEEGTQLPMGVLQLMSWAVADLRWNDHEASIDTVVDQAARRSPQDDDPWNRALGALHLGDDGLAALLYTVTDPEASDRLVARAMRGNWDVLPEHVLVALLSRSHPDVRCRAARGLARIGSADALPALHAADARHGRVAVAIDEAVAAISARSAPRDVERARPSGAFARARRAAGQLLQG